MSTQKGFNWWIPIIVLISICVLCGGLLGLSGFILSLIKKNNPQINLPYLGTYIPIATVQADLDTIITPQVTTRGPNGTLTGSQMIYDNYFFDDFSSDALGWSIYDDGMTILKYENGQYSLQVTEPDYFDWAYAPIDFYASEINFNLQGLPGPQNGTFGVFCQFHDIKNYYYVEFDLELQEYLVGVIVDDNETLLTVDPTNDNWASAQGMKSLPEQVNHIRLTCTQDYITLSINDEWNGDYQVTTPFDSPGDTAFFVYAFDFPDTAGYKVFIDDVEIFNPNPE
jgi:hypothetical protein